MDKKPCRWCERNIEGGCNHDQCERAIALGFCRVFCQKAYERYLLWKLRDVA